MTRPKKYQYNRPMPGGLGYGGKICQSNWKPPLAIAACFMRLFTGKYYHVKRLHR